MLTTLSVRLEWIRAKLDALKAADQRCRIFGAQDHRYVLGDPLSDEEMGGICAANGLKLPEDYAAFLRCIGNGGAGPDYGVHSLQQSLSLRGRAAGDVEFPHREAWQPLFGGHTWESLSRSGQLDDYMNRPVAEAEQEQYRQWEDDYFSDRHTQGTLQVSHVGCGHETLLVLNGWAAGQIWTDSRCASAGIVPTALSFLDWYEGWLDDSLTKARELK